MYGRWEVMRSEKYNGDLCEFFGELVCARVHGARHAGYRSPGLRVTGLAWVYP